MGQLRVANIIVFDMPKGRGQGQKTKKTEEIKTEIFPNLTKSMNPLLQDSRRIPSRKKQKESSNLIMIQLSKTSDKEKILKIIYMMSLYPECIKTFQNSILKNSNLKIIGKYLNRPKGLYYCGK